MIERSPELQQLRNQVGYWYYVVCSRDGKEAFLFPRPDLQDSYFLPGRPRVNVDPALARQCGELLREVKNDTDSMGYCLPGCRDIGIDGEIYQVWGPHS